MTLPTSDTIAKWVKWALVIGGVLFTAGRLAERMSHDHRFLIYELCRVEVRMGMDVPDECDRIRSNQTQAGETPVSLQGGTSRDR